MPSSQEPAAAAESGSAMPRTPSRRRLITLLTVLTVVIVVVDQITKTWAERTLAGAAPVDLIGEFLRLRLIYNPGAAFSIGTGLTWLFTLIIVIVVILIIRTAARLGSRSWAIALGLLLGGAVGNLGDRLFRQPGFPEGHVVDFIDYNGWFVGNIADIAIVVAVGLILILSFRGVPLSGTPAADDDGDPTDDGDSRA